MKNEAHTIDCLQVSFAGLSDAALVRYLEKYNLSHRGLDRPALLATVHSHFDTLAPPTDPSLDPPRDAAEPPLPFAAADAAIIERFFRKVFTGRGRAQRGRRRRRRTAAAASAAAVDEDDEREPAADWDALHLEDYGKGRRQRKVKVRTDV